MPSPTVVDVWHLSLADFSDTATQLMTCLSDSEKQRAARFVFEQDRSRFIVCRALLRGVLAKTLNLAPDAIHFEYGKKGKPHLDNKPLFFNLSHSSHQAYIVTCRDTAVGVDVERIRPPTRHTWADLAQRFFSPAEIAELNALPNPQQSDAFFTCWTRKEAYLKLHGLGLSLPLNQFSVSVNPATPARLRATEWNPEDVNRASLHDLTAPTQYRACLAIASTAPVALNTISIHALESPPFFTAV